ncbi:hypothetical protein PENDEC_c003G05555 [Penicillium decumbens]|uniref:Uncharacterized protein n=1 Tax=Penicillium decumbens TaxID=69771 RepID=A0A1V6PJR8_PENDC|nr:hypothetical protein PENDEC_c003G05555 [Penicillium decumbens]
MKNWQQRLKGYRKASGTTENEAHLPQFAPPVFPQIDRAAVRERDGLQPKSTFQSGRTWVRDCIDRKEQESFEADHQGSAVAVPKSERPAYRSRFNDPDHPASSGRLFTVLSGGRYKPNPGLIQRAGTAIKESQDKKRASQGLPPSETFKKKMTRKKKEVNNRFNSLKEDVMYLIIVNMPTEDELRKSVAQLQYFSQQKNLEEEATRNEIN